MARTASGTANTSDTTVDLTGDNIEEIYIENTGATDLQARVPTVTGDDYDTIGPGQAEYYSRASSEKTNVNQALLKTASGTTTYRVAVVKGSA